MVLTDPGSPLALLSGDLNAVKYRGSLASFGPYVKYLA